MRNRKEYFIKKSIERHGNKYDYSKVEYKACKYKVVIICKIHGDFLMTANSHVQGQGCPKCGYASRAKIRSTPDEGESLLDINPEICKEWSSKNEIGPEKYCYGSKKRVWWTCKTCKYEWEQNISGRSLGKWGCPACAGRVLTDLNRLSVRYPEIAEEWDYTKNKDLRPENVSFSQRKRVWWLCKKCNYSFYTLICSRTATYSFCPKCRMSHGERIIEKYLIKKNLKYKYQYRIKECRNELPLPFDFAIWINNSLCLIEFNGEQHYSLSNGRYDCLEKLEKRKFRDKIKENFCKNNNIPLLVIPYYDIKNIERIIYEFIKSKNPCGM